MKATYNAQTTTVNATSAGGCNSYNRFYNDTIQNCNYGIAIMAGSNSNSDIGNDIGGDTIITGNTIINFGGATGATNQAAGILFTNQATINISFNTINNNNGLGINHPNTLSGICQITNSGIYFSSTSSFTSNKITIHGGGTTQAIYGINNVVLGTSSSMDNYYISNNEISGCTYSTATTGSFYGICNTTPTGELYIYNNKIINNSQSGTGNFYCLYSYSRNYGAINIDFYSNLITDNIKTTNSKGSMYGIYQDDATQHRHCYNNEIKNLSIIGGATDTCILYGIYSTNFTSCDIYKNKIHDLSISTGGNRSGIIGIIYDYSQGAYSETVNIYKNKIYNLVTNIVSSTINGISIKNGSTYGTFNLYNNIIGNFQIPVINAVNSIIGINCFNSITNAYYNTVYFNATSTGAFNSSAFYAETTQPVTLINNILVNTSLSNATGITAAYRRSSSTLTSYGATSNNNFFYAGTPSPNNLIYYDGTVTAQSLYLFKTTVAPRDSASKTSTAIPNFLSTTGSDSLYLHINGSLPSVIFSGGKKITGYNDDFDGNIRYGSTGYVGNGTAPCIGADEFNSITTIAVNLGNDTTICAGSPLTLNAGYPGAKYTWSTGDTTQTINVNTAGTYSVIVQNGLYQIGYDTINVYVAPSTPVSVAITKSTDSICAGTNVTYTATAVNGGTSPFYQWKVNGVNQGTNDSTFTYAPANNDSITCVVISNLPTCLANNPATSNKLYMYVYPLLPASISIAANQNSVCAGTNITFTATPVNGGTLPGYQWMKNDTIINGGTNSTYSSSTLVTGDVIKCEMTSNAAPCLTGSPATSNAIAMIINQYVTPNVTIAANPTGAICQGTNVTFTASPVNGGSPTYHWYKNGIIINGQTNATYSSTSLATGDTITCEMISSLVCTTVSSATSNGIGITVNPSYNIPVNKTICQGDSIVVGTHSHLTTGIYSDTLTTSLGCDSIITTNLTVNPTWNLQTNKTICQGDSIVVGTNVYKTSGTYTDNLITTLGCDSTIITHLTVNPLPANAGTISGLTTVCQGQNSVTYTISAIANATSYIWTLPTGATGSSTTNSINVNYGASAVSGNIKVKGHNTCGDGLDSLLAVTVNPKPAKPVVTQTANTLHSSAASGNQWYNVASGILTGSTAQTYNPTSNGYYYVIVTLLGCSSDSSNHYYYTNVGIGENENNNVIKVYPNPVKEILTIETSYNKEQRLEIVNLIGQTVYTSYINKKAVINTSGFPSGIYILKLSSDKETVIRKFVKE